MMATILLIKTESAAPPWLAYILEEFRRMNGAEFEIVIQPIGVDADDSPALYYTKDFFRGVSLPNCSHIQPGGETVSFSGNVFAWKGATTSDPRFVREYDLFWNAFIALSRLEEYEAELKGRSAGSYAFRHPRKDKTTFMIPVVNALFRQLELLLKEHFPALRFSESGEKKVEFSHDVDYLVKTPHILVKKTMFHIFNTTRSLIKPSGLLANLRNTAAFLFTHPSYWGFECLEEIEKRFNRRSVFYVYAGAGISGAKKSLKTRLIDPSYHVATHDGLKMTLRRLKSAGFDIGLHGSYRSALDGGLLKKEKERLETALDINITKVRQHWLNYSERITPYLHEGLFETDSTLGWNDRMGFRAGCASRYRPYDHVGQRPFTFFEIPQFLMDAHIFDYGINTLEKSLQSVLAVFDRVLDYKDFYFAISWHTHVCNRDFPWHETYGDIVKAIARKNAL